MQLIFDEVNLLDERCYIHFKLTADLLMEHAAHHVASFIKRRFPLKSRVLIVAGSGHNGADGLAVARLLSVDYDVSVLEYKAQRSELGKVQKERALAVDVDFVRKLEATDILVDAFFGTGLNRYLDVEAEELIQKANEIEAFKIAVDIPSGILSDGRCGSAVFKADTTITMGALKSALFSDGAKDFTGTIEVAELGLSRSLYEGETDTFLLDISDMRLPVRTSANTHKGSFGHACFISGEKEGASIMAGLAALNFGVGLVTLVSKTPKLLPFELMQSDSVPKNCTALCLGMGLGTYTHGLHQSLLAWEMPLVLDADIFYEPRVKELLREGVILTPHPKEFCALLKVLGIIEVDVQSLQERRLEFVKLFMSHYPQVTLLLKGAHVIISHQNNIYINPHGSSVLSKGGSGDILCGLITALLAQGYTAIDAAITASIAHAQAGNKVPKCSYAVTARDMIESVGRLE